MITESLYLFRLKLSNGESHLVCTVLLLTFIVLYYSFTLQIELSFDKIETWCFQTGVGIPHGEDRDGNRISK